MIRIIAILLGLIYVISPYDILPDFIFGWGWIDDIIMGYLAWRYMYVPWSKGRSQNPRSSSERGPFDRDEESADYNGPNFTQKTTDPYAVLGIKTSATRDEVNKAYRELANKYHPDKVEHLGKEFKELAETRFKEINEAYEKIRKI